jgi:hypothetical protein
VSENQSEKMAVVRQTGAIVDDGEEISKKDLLLETGLSYGQFYRWKRMGLIPEAWFHRRSTFTGQETFLPRKKVLERIHRILGLKDQYSLDDLALMLSPDARIGSYPLEEILRAGLAHAQSWALLPKLEAQGELRFLDLVCLSVIEQLLNAGISTGIIQQAAQLLLKDFYKLGENDVGRYLVLATQHDTDIILLHTGICIFNENIQMRMTIDLNQICETVKVHLSELSA